MPYPPNENIASRIKRAGLPESYDVHWSKSRKEEVVKAVRDKLISFDEARWRYLLSRSEFESWQREVARENKPTEDGRTNEKRRNLETT